MQPGCESIIRMFSDGPFSVFFVSSAEDAAVIVFDDQHLIPTEERSKMPVVPSDMRLLWLDLLFAILVLSAIATL